MISREEARKRGLKRFDDTEPCKVCGCTIKYVTSRRCMDCAKNQWTKQRQESKNRMAERKETCDLILELNKQYKTPEQIADSLNYSGHVNKYGNKFNASGIITIIKNAGHKVMMPNRCKPSTPNIVLVKPSRDKEKNFHFFDDDLGEAAKW